MSSTGYLESLLNPLPADQRRTWIGFVREAFKTFRFGAPLTTDGKTASENFGGSLVTFTTSSSANAENAVAHGLDGRTPTMLIPVLPLGVEDATVPQWTVTRAADRTFFYVSCASTSVVVGVYVE